MKQMTKAIRKKLIANHKKHKKILLDLIEEMPFSQSQQNSRSDWLLPMEQERKYLDYFYQVLKNLFLTSFFLYCNFFVIPIH